MSFLPGIASAINGAAQVVLCAWVNQFVPSVALGETSSEGRFQACVLSWDCGIESKSQRSLANQCSAYAPVLNAGTSSYPRAA